MKVPPVAPPPVLNSPRRVKRNNSKARRNLRKQGAFVLEPMEPRLLLSADAILGAGATAAIIDSFEDYGSVIQGHIDDVNTDFDTWIPGILLSQRDTNDDDELDDEDVAAPHMRDMLAVEIEQNGNTGSSTSAELALQALDTDNDSVVSWDEAYRGIVVSTIEDLLTSFDSTNDADGDMDVDSDDVEKWVRDGLATAFSGSAFPGSSLLDTWFNVDLADLSTSGSGSFNLSFSVSIDFVDSYLIDLGLAADAEEIELPEWEFDFSGSTPDVDPLDRNASITGRVQAPVAITYASGEATFSPTGTILASVKAGGDGTESLAGKIVNVGFLGTEAGAGSEFELSMQIESVITDPSSPTRLGFADGDGDDNLAEILSFEAVSAGGVLGAASTPDAAFNLATDIQFDLTLDYETGDSGPIAVSVDVSAAGDTSAVRQALEDAIEGTSLDGLLTVTESGGLLQINLVGSDATALGFTDGTHFDNTGGAPFTLTGTTGFDFDADDDATEDTEVTFAEVTFLLSVAGALPKFVNVAGGTYSTAEWQAAVQAALDAAFTPGTVTATANVGNLSNVTLTLSAGSSLEICDTDTLSLKMTAVNAIDSGELSDLQNADPSQISRLFTSTTDTTNDAFAITLNLNVRDGLDFTPDGAPQFRIDASFDTYDGPFDIPATDPLFREDFNGNLRFALPMSNNADFTQYLDFNVFGRAETIAMIQQLEGWMDRLAQNVSLGGFDIPLAQSVLGEALDFADLLHDTFLTDDQDTDATTDDVGKLLQKVTDLDPDGQSIIFFTAQEFGAALNKIGILELTGSGDFATYDKANKDILYHVNAVHDIADVELPVDFTLPLPPLGNIESSSSLFLTAEGAFEAILGLRMGGAGSIDDDTLLTALNNAEGVDIYEGVAITGAQSIDRVFGRLISNAHFNVTIGGVTYAVTVDADTTETNLITADLILDIKTALTGASIISGGSGTFDLNTLLDVVTNGDRIALVAKPAVAGFSLDVSTLDSAYTQLGLQDGPASTVSVMSGPVVDPDGGNGGILTITIFGSAAVPLTIDNAVGNVSVTNLVDDINEKIAGTALQNKIVATRFGDRIVFSAIDKSVFGFSVAANATGDNFFQSPFSTLNAWLNVTAANEPPQDSLARFGRLSADATLTINGVAITVEKEDTDGTTADTSANGSLEDLAADLNAEIAASSLGTTVLAEVLDNRLVLRANSSSVTSLTVTTAGGNTARTEMGFGESQTAGQLGVTGNRAAPSYFGPTDTTSFRVNIVGGSADTGGTPETVTLAYPSVDDSGGPFDLLTNATIFDLASDLQRALNTAFGGAAANPLLVGVDAGRLLFTIKAGMAGLGATGFSILADSADTAENRAITQLKLYDPTAPIPASVNFAANQWDLLITDRDGTIHAVTLDGDLDVGDVIASINAASTDAVADIGPLGNGLQLSDNTGSGSLAVRTVNGSNAAIDLGIYLGGVNTADETGAGAIPDTAGLIIGDTIGTLALIDRVFLRQVDGDTPILSASIEIASDDPDTMEVETIDLEANFGFVAVVASGGGDLTGQVGITLVNGDSDRTTLRDLFSAVSEDRNDDGDIDIEDFDDVVNTPAFTLEGEFDFDVTVEAGGGIEALISDLNGGMAGIQVGSFTIDIDSPGNPFTATPPDVEVTWTAGNLGDLEQFSNIGFDDVLNALKLLANFLDDYADLGFLDEDLPLIGINFNELVDLADRFRSAVEEIEQNPAGSVQLLEQKIREEFGLPPGVLTLSLADGDDGDSDPGDMLKIKFNLGGSFSESLPVAFGLPDGLIDGAPVDISLEGQADLNATGSLTALFTIGVDLNALLESAAPVYLFTHSSETKIEGSLSASANDLTFNAALGPVGVTIADGSASINLNVSVMSDDAMGTRVALGDAFSAFDQITFSGDANAVLPVYFPTQSSYIGDISLEAAFEVSAPDYELEITTFDVNVPTDFNLDFSAFSLFDNLALLIDATDLFLSGVQDAMDGEILGFDLPLVGSELGEAAQFIEDFRATFVKDLRNLVENAPSLAGTTVQGFLFDLLHTKFGILDDTNGDGVVNQDDVIIEGLSTLSDADLSNDYLQWNVLLGDDIPLADINLPFDLGFPALGLEGDVGLDVTVGWELGFGLGISIAEGAYVDVRRQDYTTPADDVLPELRLTFDVNIDPDSELSGSLLFLQLDIEEAPLDIDGDMVADPTHFHAEFSVDLMKGEEADAERLAFSDLGSLDFDLDLQTDAAINFDLTLKFNEDLIGSSPLSSILPEVKAHFSLLWEWGLDDAESGEFDLSEGLKYIAFQDVRLDLGKFLGDTIGPLIAKIQEATEPFQPIIDIVTAAIPVLSDLAGEPVTLVDIAAAFGEFNPDLIYALADLISLVNSIPAEPGSLVLPFGNFVLIDDRDPMNSFAFGGGSKSDFTNPNFSFGNASDTDFSTDIGSMGSALGQLFPDLDDGVASFLSGATGDAGTQGTASSLLSGDFNRTGENGAEYGFAFPIFEDPAQIFGLLVGRPATIVTYDLPPFVIDFSWKQSFPIYGPLWGVVTASVGVKIDLAFGYDTQGVSDFFDSGFTNPLTLLGGLFIADTDKPAGGGVDVPELVFTGSIGVGAELNAGVASAGATVNIILTVNFDLYDPNNDDKIRIDELLATFLYEVRTGNPALAPLAIFDINGEVSLQLKAFIEFLFARFDFDITPQITLFEFSIPFEREPFLATERSDGSLLLNVGTNAAARMNGDLRDLSEEICVEYIGGNKAKVWAPNLGVEEGGAQIYEVNPDAGIFAYGGEGNDVIVVKGDIKVNAEGGSGDDIIVVDNSNKSAILRGGLGNDTLVGASGADQIWGDEGDDTIHGRGGADWLFGDSATITNGPDGSLRVTASDTDGNDIIWGGGENDVIVGGGGNDILAGDSDAIPGLTFGPFTVCGVMIDLDALGGTAGNDFIFGDGVRIDSAGGDDTSLTLALTGAADPDDQGRTKFAGIRLTDAAGGGSDSAYGQGGNDVLFMGSGDDQADGGANNDTIYGESGLDTLSGGANNDEIQGGLHKDTIFGFGPGPGDPYNDGGSLDADGEDLLFGDDGNDLIRGNGNSAAGLGDTIYGGRGADVLFGDAGDDDIFGENEGDVIFGGANHDYVEGGTGNDTVFGDDGLVIYFDAFAVGSDRIIGDANPALAAYYETLDDSDGMTLSLTLDLMITEVNGVTDGNDTVIGGEGDDIAFGGAGNDTLFGDLDPVQWLAAYAAVTPPPVPAGQDTLIGDGGRVEWFGRRIDKIESFKGVNATEAGDDTISGNGGPDRLLGGGGNDTMYGRMPESFAGNSKLDEDAGVDAGKEISDDDIMIGDDGVIDIAQNTTKLVKINTTIYDPLAGETYVDTMFGNWGRDVMLGGLGGDTMSGDTGLTFSDPRSTDDIMLGDNGELLYANNVILENFGRLELIRTTDVANHTGGADTIHGLEGDDVILGGVNGSNDVLNGNVGNDVILGDNGELDFAFGADTNLDTLDLIRSYLDELGGIDIISGDAGSDVLIGGTAGDEMYGDNAAASNGGQDGEDVMLGDNADIFLIGTTGRLTVRVADMPAGTAVDLITTTDTVADEDTGGADTMSGNAKSDIMLGGVNDGGIDTMYGDRAAATGTTIANDGDDILVGDNGLLDFTFGDTDRNILDLIRSFEDGRGGTDNISGNKGLDAAIGGTGSDTIYGDDATASAAANDLADLLLGDNADIFLVAPLGLGSGSDLKLVLGAAVKTIKTTDEENPAFGGEDTISGNAKGDIIAGGVKGDTLYGDREVPNPTTTANEGNDIILGDNGAFEWLSSGRLSEITGIDIAANNAALFAKYNPGLADTDLTTLDLITTEQPTRGGRDTIFGDEGKDLVFGGTDADTIYGDDGLPANLPEGQGTASNNDLIMGDHGRLYPQFSQPNLSGVQARNFFAIDIGSGHGGEGDRIWGEEGHDIIIGQQGDDRMFGGSGDDDMIGGHNVSGGWDELDPAGAVQSTIGAAGVNDLMDGGSGNDAMAGDNAIIWRRNDDLSPRFRALTGPTIYTTAFDTITANVGADSQSDPADVVGRDIQLVDHSFDVQSTPQGRFGNDVMAGGADLDTMFGELGNDLMQGDGSLGTPADGGPNTKTLNTADSGAPSTAGTLYFNVPEASTDGDDYMEGNGGSDLIYGGLGQDDILGGSSELFGLTVAAMRPDSSDSIFGGAGIDISRNDIGDATEDGTTHVITTTETGHARDADYIMGDNADIFRLVQGGASGTNPADAADIFLTFAYDNYGALKIIPRAMKQLDYTLGGADYAGGTYTNGAANADNGAADLIHGESGDDIIFGMTGSDVIFGEGQDDDIVGGYGNDWISGGTGQDGVLGDDGLIFTSRNGTAEPLYGLAATSQETITTPGQIQTAVINVTGELKKTVELIPFSFDPAWNAMDDEYPDNADNTPYADDIMFGGLGGDFLHGGSGDDAISGAEALDHAYVPTYDADGNPTGILDLGYAVVGVPSTMNPGDVLAFNPIDLDGQHENNRLRAGEFTLYDEYDPRLTILLDSGGNPWKSADQGTAYEFLLNFNKDEGVLRPGGSTGKGGQALTYGPVHDDGNDAAFGDLGNDWLVGGTGRDNMYGGWGNDLINADDDHTTNGNLNDEPDTHPTYEDRAYGGAGRDVLIANTGGDRLIDWVGEFNSYLVPFAPFGEATVSRTLQPFLPEFLYALSKADGADQSQSRDTGASALRNGEPAGEMGLVLQTDFAWQDQTGAPADPQPGNIPGGQRDVLRSADFNNGQAQAFFADSGNWTVSGGRYQVSPTVANGDAVSVFYVDQYIPRYFEMLTTINADKPTGGANSNGYVVFDYQSPTDFKFAGINASTNKLEIGHRTAQGWIVDVQGSYPSQIKSNSDYNLFLSINGTAVTLIVDNKVTLTHTFAPRVDIYGVSHGINDGMVGLGARNSTAQIDNVVVQRLAPVVTLSKTVDFSAGPTTLFDAPLTGAWTVAGERYDAAAGTSTPALDLMSFNVSPASLIDLSATLKTTGEGGFVYDQYAVDDFKFVTVSDGKITLGHRTSKGWFTDAVVSNSSLTPGTDSTLGLTLKGTTVSVTLNNQTVASHVYNAVVTDGNFGLLSRTGTTSFDTVTVKTDEPALGNQSFALTAAEPTQSVASPSTMIEWDGDSSGIGDWNSISGWQNPAKTVLPNFVFEGFNDNQDALQPQAPLDWYVEV